MTAEISTVIAFDYGERRIGVAVGQTLSATAEPLIVLKRKDGNIDWTELQGIIAEWRPDQLLVGFPETKDGKEIPLHKAIKDFADELILRFKLPLEYCDEHLSSHEAKQSPLATKAAKKHANKHAYSRGEQSGRRGKSRNTNSTARAIGRPKHIEIDAIAAQLILETWLASAHTQKS